MHADPDKAGVSITQPLPLLFPYIYTPTQNKAGVSITQPLPLLFSYICTPTQTRREYQLHSRYLSFFHTFARRPKQGGSINYTAATSPFFIHLHADPNKAGVSITQPLPLFFSYICTPTQTRREYQLHSRYLSFFHTFARRPKQGGSINYTAATSLFFIHLHADPNKAGVSITQPLPLLFSYICTPTQTRREYQLHSRYLSFFHTFARRPKQGGSINYTAATSPFFIHLHADPNKAGVSITQPLPLLFSYICTPTQTRRKYQSHSRHLSYFHTFARRLKQGGSINYTAATSLFFIHLHADPNKAGVSITQPLPRVQQKDARCPITVFLIRFGTYNFFLMSVDIRTTFPEILRSIRRS